MVHSTSKLPTYLRSKLYHRNFTYLNVLTILTYYLNQVPAYLGTYACLHILALCERRVVMFRFYPRKTLLHFLPYFIVYLSLYVSLSLSHSFNNFLLLTTDLAQPLSAQNQIKKRENVLAPTPGNNKKTFRNCNASVWWLHTFSETTKIVGPLNNKQPFLNEMLFNQTWLENYLLNCSFQMTFPS